jgi:general L-amino acid transport system permease protein
MNAMHPPAVPIPEPALIAARPAPLQARHWLHQLRLGFWSDWTSALTTVLLLLLLALCLPELLSWAVLRASVMADASRCQMPGAGACWGVITEKYRFILLGRYPFEEQWRPLLATVLLVGLLLLSCIRALWKPYLVWAWSAVLALFFVLMYGNVWGMSRVETDRWGGLPLTLLLSTLSILMAFPLALAVALGRRSGLPAIRWLCTAYVELVRGVPLVSVLFMASFLLPLLMPQGLTVDVLLRVLLGITLFAAAYMAEVVRGGLQAVPSSQVEAAASIGLSWWQTQRKVVLPQALTVVLPGLMNNFIGLFKDTSLVTIVSLYELTGSLSLALNSDADWRPYKVEGYLFIALIYFVFCFGMSRYSLRIEHQLQQRHTTALK